MNYQVSSVEYTVPIPDIKDNSEEKYTATVIKVDGKLNLDNIILPREDNSQVYIKNNKNEWVFMNIYYEPEDNYCAAYCVDNELNVWWYNIMDKKDAEAEDYDEQGYGNGAASQLRKLYYLTRELG